MSNHGPDFLIVGLERSGTHWVTALLNSHPQISCFPYLPFFSEKGGFNDIVGEVHLFDTLASLEDKHNKFSRPIENYLDKHQGLFSDLAKLALKGNLPKEELYKKFIQRYNEICDSQRGHKKLVGESSPAYVFHLDFIDSFYPSIKKICILRDPKDRITSWHYHQIRKGRKKDSAITDDFALDYLEKVKQEHESLINYQGNLMCISYEGLNFEPQAAITKMLDYLDVEINDKVIQDMLAGGDFKKLNALDSGKPGREKGQQSIQSHYRKGIVGDWKNNMSQEQAQMIEQQIGELQQRVFEKYNLN